jgi:methanogenic corrinoid protein MtbC1
VEEVREYEPDILGLSGILIPIAATGMRKTVEAVRADRAEAGRMPFVIIGGRVDQAIADYVRSDSWTTDAMEGARICQRFMEAMRS